MIADMGNKITVTAEKDGRTVIFEGSGTLTTTERVGKWVGARPTSTSRDVHGVEIEWDGTYTIREADHRHVTLDDLAAAWEAAEEADECRKGDVLIVPGSWGGYTIWAAARGTKLRAARVLSRAPREPWSDLADVLADMGHLSPTGHAKALYERGVRMAGGDDDA